MPAPSNTSALTAVDLGTLPASVSQDVHDAGTTYTVWYSYTAVADGVIGVWGFGDLTVYRPTIACFIGPAAAPVAYLTTGQITAQNKPVQLPVESGTTYYFRFTPNAGNPTPAVLLIEASTAPAEELTEETIFINDDTLGHPAAVLSTTVDYETLAFVLDMPAGEAGDIASNGNFILENIVSGEALVFGPPLDYTLLATIANFGTGDLAIRTCRSVDKFYVATTTGSPIKLKRFSNIGVEESLVNVTGVTSTIGIAVDNDEAILYYVDGTDSAVKRWDMIGATGLSDLAATVATYIGYDILILQDADDSILPSYAKNSSPRSFRVRRYNPAGTLLNTYDLDAYVNSATTTMTPRLAYAPDDNSAFWVFIPDSDDGQRRSKFLKIRVSDGAILIERRHVTYNQGAYDYAETATPLSLFGHSSSCPFFIMPISGGGGADEDAIIGPLVWVHWPRRIPVINPDPAEPS